MQKEIEIRNTSETLLKQLEEVLELSRVITSTFAWEEILENIVKRAVELIPGADTGNIFIYRSGEDLLIPEFGWGFAKDIFKKIKLKPGESVSGKVFLNRKPTLFKIPSDVADVMADLQKHNYEFYSQVVPGHPGFHSSLCAPLIWKDECLGVLSVHNVCSPIQFSEDNLQVIKYVATHAAVALANSRLYEQQRIHMTKLERSVTVHEKITQMVLNGEGLEKIAIELATLLSQSVYIFDTLLECVAKVCPDVDKERVALPIPSVEDIQHIDNRRRPVLFNSNVSGIGHLVGISISAGDSILGYLMVGVNDPAQTESELRTTVERASMVIALEMMKKKVEYETEQRMKIDLLEEMLQGNITKNTFRRLSFIGYNPSKSYICLVCSPYVSKKSGEPSWNDHHDQVFHTFCQTYPGIIMISKGETFVVLHSLNESRKMDKEKFTEVYKKAKEFVNHLYKAYSITIQVGVGRPFQNIKDMHVSYREAKQALVLLQKYGGDDKIWTYRSLGPLRFLLEVAGEKELRGYMEETLEPLLDKHSILLETLLSWFSNERQIKRTAEALFLHPNTVSYRLNKIEELLNINIKDEDDLLTIQIALRLWQILST